ncbi:MAG: hypothetical protein LBV45_00620 [Xanthomonadaceae bacterium]|nr:hypothetical protein [Xanthomonadaceae bacterium]
MRHTSVYALSTIGSSGPVAARGTAGRLGRTGILVIHPAATSDAEGPIITGTARSAIAPIPPPVFDVYFLAIFSQYHFFGPDRAIGLENDPPAPFDGDIAISQNHGIAMISLVFHDQRIIGRDRDVLACIKGHAHREPFLVENRFVIFDLSGITVDICAESRADVGMAAFRALKPFRRKRGWQRMMLVHAVCTVLVVGYPANRFHLLDIFEEQVHRLHRPIPRLAGKNQPARIIRCRKRLRLGADSSIGVMRCQPFQYRRKILCLTHGSILSGHSLNIENRRTLAPNVSSLRLDHSVGD